MATHKAAREVFVGDFMRQTVEAPVAEPQGFCDEMTAKKHESNSRGVVIRRRASHQGDARARARPSRCGVLRDHKRLQTLGKDAFTESATAMRMRELFSRNGKRDCVFISESNNFK